MCANSVQMSKMASGQHEACQRLNSSRCDAGERDGNSLGVGVPGATTHRDLRSTILGFASANMYPSPCDHVGEHCDLALKEKATLDLSFCF